jgi:hypothetical protein
MGAFAEDCGGSLEHFQQSGIERYRQTTIRFDVDSTAHHHALPIFHANPHRRCGLSILYVSPDHQAIDQDPLEAVSSNAPLGVQYYVDSGNWAVSVENQHVDVKAPCFEACFPCFEIYKGDPGVAGGFRRQVYLARRLAYWVVWPAARSSEIPATRAAPMLS